MAVLLESSIPGVPVRRGKVRDVYDLGEFLLLVSTDRISAFDWVLPSGIPDKGRVLCQLSAFWFEKLGEPHHMVSIDPADWPLPKGTDRAALEGRSMLVRKAEILPIECVVRGYLAGSGWKEYRQGGAVCGVRLPPGLRESEALADPIFTPATKAETGHDENITFDEMVARVGGPRAEEARGRSLALFRRGAEYARTRGVIIADTKFEWGLTPQGLILCDEVLTPDSSRFWPADVYRPGGPQPSFDKQFVRDWLERCGWDKQCPPPALPDDVVERTREKYLAAYKLLTGKLLAV